MNRFSTLFVLLFIASPIFADTMLQQINLRIVDTYCAPVSRNTHGALEVFRSLCTGFQHVQCCNNLVDQIRAHPDWHLCVTNENGYIFSQNGCSLQISNRNSFDPQIYFPSDQLNQRLRQTTANPTPTQTGSHVFQFGDNPQYNIQVRTSTSAETLRPTQLAAVQAQNSFTGANSNYDDNDETPVVIIDSRGYQAMSFALNLFKNLDRPANGDSVISPLLPQQLLSNLVDYASPIARKQLQKTVQLDSQQLSDITINLDKVSKSSVNTIETATANFIAKDIKLNNTYRIDARLRNVDVLPVDFANPNQAARKANNWVSEKTHNLINEILNPGAINPYTRLLLVNTIYFKGKWKYTFIETNPGSFESSPNNPRQLSKMFQLNKLRYGELSFPDGNGLRWVELPYEDEKLSMLVFLPTQRHQLEASIRQLTPEQLAKVMADIQSPYINTKVHLNIPKFTLTDTVSLIPTLKRMGLHSIFQDADALQYLTNESTVVSDITQRSYMSVDEFGTKATSVASLSIITLSVTPQYKDVRFDVDQPFMVMVVDKQERYPFFIGQIYNPRQ